MRLHHGIRSHPGHDGIEEAFVQNLDRLSGGPFNFRREQFERLGLHRTNEPMRVYCERCGEEIDPWKAFADAPQEWWRCPRGCNEKAH